MRPSFSIACAATSVAAAAVLCAAPASAQQQQQQQQQGHTALHAAVEQQNLGDLQALLSTPEGLRLIDTVPGLSHAELQSIVGLPIKDATATA